MKSRLLRAFLILVLLLPLSCVGPAQSDRLVVLTTVLPQADMVRQIGGDNVEVIVMVPPGQDPHTYQLGISQMVKVSQAKAYFILGSGLDFERTSLEKIKAQNQEMLIFNTSEGIEIEGNDPHIWLSVTNAKVMVQNICDGLKKIDSDNADYYQSNCDRYLDKLEDLDKDIEEKLATVDERYFLVYHPAFGYFASEYGLTQLAVEEEGKDPATADLARIIEEARAHDIDYVFVEPWLDPSKARVIVSELGAEIKVLDPLPESYIEGMKDITDLIYEELAS
jgi:zinc transport system substrate-binding protein